MNKTFMAVTRGQYTAPVCDVESIENQNVLCLSPGIGDWIPDSPLTF